MGQCSSKIFLNAVLKDLWVNHKGKKEKNLKMILSLPNTRLKTLYNSSSVKTSEKSNKENIPVFGSSTSPPWTGSLVFSTSGRTLFRKAFVVRCSRWRMRKRLRTRRRSRSRPRSYESQMCSLFQKISVICL